MRKSLSPGSNRGDRERIKIDRERWYSGIVNDPPAASIPDSALAYGENIICTKREIVPRTGSRLWTNYEIPSLTDRTGISASKSSITITASSPVFSAADVGSYFVWPGTTDEHDLITTYVSTTQVRVADSGTKTLTANCYLRGRLNVRPLWHKVQKRFVFMFNNELWTTDLDMGEWTRITCISRDNPISAVSTIKEFDDKTCKLYNSGGVFTIDLSFTNPVLYRCNTPIPLKTISEQESTDDTEYQYEYIYGSARLEGNDIFTNRLTPARIEQESGTNEVDSDKKDYVDVWTEDPIGPATYTYGKLTCNTLSVTYQDPSALEEISDGSFSININALGWNDIYCDFTDTKSWAEICEIIQLSLRDFFPNAVCYFKNNQVIVTSGRVKNGSISYMKAASGGTDIASILLGTEAAGAVSSTPYINSPNVIGPLYVPKVNNTDPQEYQWHLTHFPIYRNMDLNNTYKQDTSEFRFNDPERFIWVKDLRMCGAFYGRKFNNHALLLYGRFEQADVGSTIEWEDGTRNTILGFVDSRDAIIGESSGYGIETGMMAACIGNGRVMRASQSGTTVTRTAGDSFSEDDEGKAITWAIGYKSIISEYLSANQVTVLDSASRAVQGLTLDPTYRYFNDTVTDNELRTRQTTLLCRTRFLEAMSDNNIGAVAPGFMITARRNAGEFEYCHLPEGHEYTAGYHNKGYQIVKTVKDAIQQILVLENRFAILCTNRTWVGTTASDDYVTVDNTGVVVYLLGGVDILDGNIGCFDWGSIQETQYGKYIMLTNEENGIGIREFNGYSFEGNFLEVPNTDQTNWADVINDLQKATCSLYDGHMGYLIWGTE